MGFMTLNDEYHDNLKAAQAHRRMESGTSVGKILLLSGA